MRVILDAVAITVNKQNRDEYFVRWGLPELNPLFITGLEINGLVPRSLSVSVPHGLNEKSTISNCVQLTFLSASADTKYINLGVLYISHLQQLFLPRICARDCVIVWFEEKAVGFE